MAVIEFLPDRLNVAPVVYRGFTTGELGLAAGLGVVLGIPLAFPLAFVPFIGWIAFPTCMLIAPLFVVFLGGKWISSFKRGKPENYLWRRLDELKATWGMSRGLILISRSWELKRTRSVFQRGRS
ncbi:TIGR03750 family conjugal transfer protein [Pectobacterium carotovorum]|uniref:TIGR03750 family conjugal transfer protein n=1 Tax=Pectobacterium TaxID=122277 RepID=UPI001CCD4310|nr:MULTISPECIES: TIGR03750 family conjugal transfer protein [Pectobacterium]MCA6970671.1 TIGR03750 family conjugal transfer protein [Pectobacterium carotovorum]